MPDRVLVTGGLGFVGSALVVYLVDRGYDVTIFDNGSRGNVENVDPHNVGIVDGDVCDQAALSRCLSAHDFSTVVHLAASAFHPGLQS